MTARRLELAAVVAGLATVLTVGTLEPEGEGWWLSPLYAVTGFVGAAVVDLLLYVAIGRRRPDAFRPWTVVAGLAAGLLGFVEAGLYWFSGAADEPPPGWQIAAGIVLGVALLVGGCAVLVLREARRAATAAAATALPAAANVVFALVVDWQGDAVGWALAPAVLLAFAVRRARRQAYARS